ncbi:hypothetical protein OCAR_6823 [Afipia carboxidovorans OM5]|nr:hypothetical protein OCAR_6823 [Afipia carboxidovorans OM5]
MFLSEPDGCDVSRQQDILSILREIKRASSESLILKAIDRPKSLIP